MPNFLRRRARAGLVVGVTVLAASVASLSLAGLTPASASSNLPPGNSIIIGSGSQTAYSLMVGLDNLFNSSQGCDEIATPTQTQSLSFNCPSGATGLPSANGENPRNDVALQEPPLGGSNGLKQLEGQVPVDASAAINFATTVRNPLPADPTGLNFVNYGDDALSWFHFTKVRGKATPSAKIKSLTIADLAGIWSGTYTKWNQIPGAGGGKGPIDVYVTNSGAGVYSLWQQYLGVPSLEAYVDSKPAPYPTTHTIEQNEDASIIANGDEADAIFFFSNGRFQESCAATVCGGTPVPGTTAKRPSTAVLGEINSVRLTDANILSGAWPAIVFLSNVYSDGSNSTIPVASPATLNYVSEDGFLCKPQTQARHGKIIDPLTGVWYRTEIAGLITAAHDVPLTLGPEGTVPHPAVLRRPYKGYDSSGTDPEGYCRVLTTDGNT